MTLQEPQNESFDRLERRFITSLQSLVFGARALVLGTRSTLNVWCAPVYFAYFEGVFVFFSSPHSQHIQNAMNTDRVAGTVFEDSENWSRIRGLQMTGDIRPVKNKTVLAKAFKAYQQKFPFGDRLQSHDFGGSVAGFQKLLKVNCYRFNPHEIVLSDNRMGFGFKRSFDHQYFETLIAATEN